MSAEEKRKLCQEIFNGIEANLNTLVLGDNAIWNWEEWEVYKAMILESREGQELCQ